MSLRTIVCGVDHELRSRAAAHAAAALAGRLGLRLELVHAVTGAARTYGAPHDHALRRDRERAHELGERLMAGLRRELAGADVGTRVCPGAAAPCLAETARETDAALIVVRSRGRSAVQAVLAGAVTDQLLPCTPCPVMVVPPQLRATDAATLAGDHVLCGIQHTDDADCVQVAARLARGLGLPLKLAHVLPRSPDVAALTPAGVLPLAVASRGETLERDAETRLRHLAERLDPRAEVDLWVGRGDAGHELAELAAEGAALVVVGTRRWRGAGRAALLGSVARHLACNGASPVVVCPAAA